jgi:hypothetical protein
MAGHDARTRHRLLRGVRGGGVRRVHGNYMKPQPDQADIGALSDLCTPWCIHVVATLRIADHIAAGITQIDDLAAASATHSDSLHRVLQHLVSKGMFEEPALGQFALNRCCGTVS